MSKIYDNAYTRSYKLGEKVSKFDAHDLLHNPVLYPDRVRQLEIAWIRLLKKIHNTILLICTKSLSFYTIWPNFFAVHYAWTGKQVHMLAMRLIKKKQNFWYCFHIWFNIIVLGAKCRKQKMSKIKMFKKTSKFSIFDVEIQYEFLFQHFDIRTHNSKISQHCFVLLYIKI